jgi:hypothetical protein
VNPRRKNMSKVILTLSLAMAAAVFVPQPVAAEDCTRQYMRCLNDTWDTSGWLRVLADLECGAQYAGCVAGLLISR